MPSSLRIEAGVPCSFLRGWKRRLTELGKTVLHSERDDGYQVDVIVVDDTMITSLNTQYLQHPWPTDVIAFPLHDEKSDSIEGEIYVSCDTALRQAREYGVRPVEEFARLMTHGLLHLCGHRDDTPARKRAIRQLENRYLRDHGIAVGEPDAP